MADEQPVPPTLTLPPLASPESLALAVGRSASDPKVLDALNRASARFRGAVRWHVDQAETEKRLDGHGRVSLRLPAQNVTACAVTLTENAVTRTLVDGVDFEWSADGILDRIGTTWPARRRCVQVIYTAGYSPVPDEVQEAVIDQAAAIYRIRRGLSSKQVGGITETFGSQEAVGVTEQWTTVVERYRVAVGDRA